MVVHADYTQSCYSIYPKFNHPKIKKVLGITQYVCDTVKAKFGIDCELCYNPLVLEPKQKRIVLVSATRLSAIKGGERMRRLAMALDHADVNYVWYVFTNENDIIGSPNVCFIKERLNVYKWIQEADYLVQLSDTEACSYSINEAMGYGTKVIVTPLPYLEEIGINKSNALILNFDLSNLDEIVEKIKRPERVSWQMPEDNYKKYLVKSKSTYKEMKTKMKLIRVKTRFKDSTTAEDPRQMIWREKNFEYWTDNQRADDLIARGFATLVAEEKEPVIEKAVKPEVKEKPVKEEKKTKAIKVEAKKEKAVKKNAKK